MLLGDKPCVKLEAADGSIRLVVSGIPYRLRPGEKVVGVDRTCGVAKVDYVAPGKDDFAVLKDEIDQAVGVGAGDWIKTLAKPFAKLAGKTGCTACEARRLATNAYAQLKGKHGQLKAMSIMKDLWQMSFTEEPEAVLAKLKSYL